MPDGFYVLVVVVLFLSALIASPFLIYKFYKILNYLLTKSKYRNYILFLVCGIFSADCIYSAYYGVGIINTDPMSMYARIICIFGAIFIGAIGLQGIIKDVRLKAILNAIIYQS
jgi:hypothetical protein